MKRLLLVLSLLLAPLARAEDVTVFAAASLTDALGEIGKAYEAAGKGKVVASFASSSDLARQIEHGAPADIFISADQQWADYLDQHGLIEKGSRLTLLSNDLVLVAPAGSDVKLAIGRDFPLAAALGDGRLAVGDPDHVPAGIYAHQALDSLGVWDWSRANWRAPARSAPPCCSSSAAIVPWASSIAATHNRTPKCGWSARFPPTATRR